jgi:hypothetical protein
MLIGAFASGVLPGCGGDPGAAGAVKVYPVQGKVLLDGGKPLSAGKVVFVPTGDSLLAATGTIQSDGSFSLETPGSGPGAPPGEYKVRIEADPSQLPKARPGGRGDGRGLPFPLRYSDEGSSELAAVVEPRDNTIEPFQLSNKPPAKKVADR